MKKMLFPLTFALLLGSPLLAQEPVPAAAAPAPSRAPGAPAANDSQRLELMPSDSPRLTAPPLPLIPEAPVEPPSKTSKKQKIADASATEKKTKTEVAAEAMSDRVNFRRAKTKALSDPAVQAQWDRAQAAKTDYQKREVLKVYFSLLYARMLKVDPSIKAAVELARTSSINRVTQKRVSETEAVEDFDQSSDLR